MTFRFRFEIQGFPHLYEIKASSLEDALQKHRAMFTGDKITSIEELTPGTENNKIYVWIGNQWEGSWQCK